MRLAELCSKFSTGPFGSMVHKSDYVTANGVSMINPANIVDGKIVKDKIMAVSSMKALELKRYALQENDILLARRGDLSKCAIVDKTNINCLCGTGSFFLHLILVLPSYFEMVYSTEYVQSILQSKCVGATMDNLNQDVLGNILFPLPPIAEQQRIVSQIEIWFTFIDEIETKKQDLQKLVKQAKNRILSLAISGKLVAQDPNDEPAIELLKRINPSITTCNSHYPQLPQGWQVAPMQMLCNLVDGDKQNGIERINLDVKYLRGKGESVTLLAGKFVPANSTMILVDGENSGEIFTTPIEGYQGSTFKLLDISNEIYKPFILYVVKSHQTKFRENKVGSAIPHLNKKLFKEINVLVPPFEEQKLIASKIDEVFSSLDTIITEL